MSRRLRILTEIKESKKLKDEETTIMSKQKRIIEKTSNLGSHMLSINKL